MTVTLVPWCFFSLLVFFQSVPAQGQKTKAAACSIDQSGLKLPAGFCATVFADGIGHARHLTVAPSGVVYVNTWSGDYYDFDKVPEGGFLVALQDKAGAGKADVIERFGETVADRRSGRQRHRACTRVRSTPRSTTNRPLFPTVSALVPPGAAETVVSGLPLGGDHPMHPFFITSDGSLLYRHRLRDQFLPAAKPAA